MEVSRNSLQNKAVKDRLALRILTELANPEWASSEAATKSRLTFLQGMVKAELMSEKQFHEYEQAPNETAKLEFLKSLWKLYYKKACGKEYDGTSRVPLEIYPRYFVRMPASFYEEELAEWGMVNK